MAIANPLRLTEIFTMRITLFARVDPNLNPYILLFKQTLERQGMQVQHERELGLRWLLFKNGLQSDVLHLHWIEAAYKPVASKQHSFWIRKLLNNRLSKSWRGLVRFLDFALALSLARLQHKQIVYTVHNLASHTVDQTWFLNFLEHLANKLVFGLADRIHVHNQYTRHRVEQDHGRFAGVEIIPHGNYLGQYPNTVSQREARRHLNLPDDAFVYLFLGMLRPYKGLEKLIGAYQQLDVPDSRLLIVGQVERAAYQNKLISLVRDDFSIKLVPEFIADEELQFYLKACDVFVLPYQYLATSGAALLALSFGRPLIAPRIASFPELIGPDTGILYDPDQPEGLFQALNQASQESWSEQKIMDYAGRFDWDKLGLQLTNLYRTGLDYKVSSSTGIG
ncbi:MAG TPA: glycosyltransferase [Anaerolineae bacterium]|nr:glycosyltransferase [Anaerolineae bacterium]